MQELLFWLDVESTGLKPETEALLQVAGIMTDLDGHELADPVEWVIRHDNPQELRENANPFVREMHDNTGLWDRLPSGTPLETVDTYLHEYVKAVAPEPRQARLAGNSIRLDLNFSEFYLPRTYGHLHYRSVDVSALAYTLESWGMVPGYYEKKKSHDAVDDIRESLEEYRWLKAHLDANH